MDTDPWPDPLGEVQPNSGLGRNPRSNDPVPRDLWEVTGKVQAGGMVISAVFHQGLLVA